jgi:hypothetical protein
MHQSKIFEEIDPHHGRFYRHRPTQCEALAMVAVIPLPRVMTRYKVCRDSAKSRPRLRCRKP